MMRTALGVVMLMAWVTGAHAALLVNSVIPGGPAAASGLQSGDRFVLLDGRKIANMDDLAKVTDAHRPGDTIPLIVQRDGKTLELALTFGESSRGGVSIGVRLNVEVDPAAERTPGTVECLAWIERNYRIPALAREFGIDVSDAYQEVLACVEHDTQRMPSARAIKFCENVFKVHCSALDLVLTDVGEAEVNRCEELLDQAHGLDVGQYKGWKTCGQHDVFDRYSKSGESSDAGSCQAALLDKCGTNLDAPARAGSISPAQQSFVACCSADALGSDSAECPMIDSGFARGPCHDRSVCVNRQTTEWIHCSVLQ